MITLSRGIRNKEMGTGQEKEGVFFIDLNYSAISELCDQSMVGNQGYAFIVDADGNIVYHPQQQQLYNELQTENIDLVMNAGSDIVTWGDGINKKMYSISRSEKTGWTVVDCVRVEELLRRSNEAQSIYVLVAIGLMAVALFFSRFVAKSITLPIQRLCDSMERVQEGDFSVSDIVVDSENEIGSLTKSFNVMTHRIHELMEQNIREQEAKRKSELKALQSQINPHFLYNTLDSIMWMIESERYQDAVFMVHALGKLFRISLSRGRNIITVGEELQHAGSYLDIQKYRYKNKFTSFFEVEEGIEKYRTIKLIIQPLIENAIYYGMEYMDGEGEIYIRAYTKDQELFIEVADNGPGMPEEQVAGLLTEESETRSRGSGIGLKNVHQRIQLYFGTEYGLEIESEPDEGTTVRIHLPKTEEASSVEKGDRQ